ncbi:MAG: methylenetetrahydrofolate reductase [Woeseiaceae bacterium]|nr:methylenetetrahydrofolate reductase [Woeseiaceae bacterium]
MPSTPNPFRDCLESGHFALTAELTPPRGAELRPLTEAAAILKPAVTAVNLTDGAGARVRMASLAAAIHLKQQGVEPILQQTCRDRNRIAIQGDLLAAAAFGVQNLLVLSGDRVDAGDEGDATPVFDFDARSLLDAIREMHETGATLSGAPLTVAPDLYCGCADIVQDTPAGWTPAALAAKADAGARFVQMQYCYDMERLASYMARLADNGLTERLYFLVGLGPLRSARSARWMRDSLFGTVMPDGVIRRMESARDPEEEGIEICAELIRAARDIPGVSGAHLMAPGNHRAIVASVRLAGMM